MLYHRTRIFFKQISTVSVLNGSLVNALGEYDDFWTQNGTDISQGTVATCFKSGEMIKHNFIADLSPSLKSKIENRLILEVIRVQVYTVYIAAPLYPDMV